MRRGISIEGHRCGYLINLGSLMLIHDLNHSVRVVKAKVPLKDSSFVKRLRIKEKIVLAALLTKKHLFISVEERNFFKFNAKTLKLCS